MEAQREDQSTVASEPPPRKPYRAPTLTSWGSLQEMTRTVGTSGAPDGGKSATKRATR